MVRGEVYDELGRCDSCDTVSILRSHLGGVTVIAEVSESFST